MGNWNSTMGDRVLAAAPQQVFTYCGRTLRGVRTMLKRADVNTDEGLYGLYEFSLICGASAFTGLSAPEPRKSLVTIDGKLYRVLTVSRDAIGMYVLNLGDYNA